MSDAAVLRTEGTIMEEFFGESVTGSGGLHAIGFRLPLDWPADPGAREEMEQKLIDFISFQTTLLELREQGAIAPLRDPLYETALEQLAKDVSAHWPVDVRPSVVASLLQRFSGQDEADDEPK